MARHMLERASAALVYVGIVSTFAAVSLIALHDLAADLVMGFCDRRSVSGTVVK